MGNAWSSSPLMKSCRGIREARDKNENLGGEPSRIWVSGRDGEKRSESKGKT